MQIDSYWMQHSLNLAHQALQANEVPIGCCIVVNNKCIANGYNQSISTNNPCGHAEIIALINAGKSIGNYRLINSTIYVTLEPCLMCYGAMVHARVKRLVYAAKDNKVGLFSSGKISLLADNLNHNIQIESGILAKESENLLKNFFKAKR